MINSNEFHYGPWIATVTQKNWIRVHLRQWALATGSFESSYGIRPGAFLRRGHSITVKKCARPEGSLKCKLNNDFWRFPEQPFLCDLFDPERPIREERLAQFINTRNKTGRSKLNNWMKKGFSSRKFKKLARMDVNGIIYDDGSSWAWSSFSRCHYFRVNCRGQQAYAARNHSRSQYTCFCVRSLIVWIIVVWNIFGWWSLFRFWGAIVS